MSIKEGLLAEIQQETNNTRRIINSIDDSHLSWKPHDKSMSLGDLIGHIVELHSWVSEGLSVEDFDLAALYQPFKPSSKAEALQHLDVGLDNNIQFLNEFNGELWNAIWKFRFGDHVIAELPRIAGFRFIIQNHLIHHRGQLSVYLRLLDIPVPGLYGPSADEHQG